jgi:hypothetical protein
MNVVKKMSKDDKLRLPKKQTKGGVRKQKMFLRKAIARKLGVPASDLKGKTFEELVDLLDKEDLKDVLATLNKANLLLGDEEVAGVLDEMLDIVDITESRPPEGFDEIDDLEDKYNKRKEELRKLGYEVYYKPDPEMKSLLRNKRKQEKEKQPELGGIAVAVEDELEKTQLMETQLMETKKIFREGLEEKYESRKMDDDDRFSDNFFRGVNSYGSFIPNPIVPERRRFKDFSIRKDIEEQNRNMRNDPDMLVEPPQNILEQNRILEGPDDVMPEAEVEPQNPARVNYEMSVASNNMNSMEQNVLDRNARNVRIAQRRILGEEDPDDEFGENLEVEMKEELEEKYDPNLLVREDETREQSFLNNKARLDKQIEELSLASQSKRNQTRGKQAHYQREAMARLKATDKMSQMNLDALRQKEIQWKRPTRTQAGNSVGLVRQSNRSMALRAHELLP